MACGCTESTPCVSLCNDANGCPIQLDFDCVIYHKDNNEINNLASLGLTNGATLNLFAEVVANYIAQIKVADFILPCLRNTYTINTIRQLSEAIDTELCQIKTDIGDLETLVNLPITGQDSDSINLTTSGVNNHTLKADVRVSVQGTNLLDVLLDGLHVAPQTLSVDAINKTLSISDGNTVSLAGLGCSVDGFLGDLAADPASPVNGTYWFNTTTNELKMKVSTGIKVFTTV